MFTPRYSNNLYRIKAAWNPVNYVKKNRGPKGDTAYAVRVTSTNGLEENWKAAIW